MIRAKIDQGDLFGGSKCWSVGQDDADDFWDSFDYWQVLFQNWGSGGGFGGFAWRGVDLGGAAQVLFVIRAFRMVYQAYLLNLDSEGPNSGLKSLVATFG